MQVVKQEQGDNAAEGVGDGDRALDNPTARAGFEFVVDTDPATTSSARNLGARLAVRITDADADRISTRVAQRVGVARKP